MSKLMQLLFINLPLAWAPLGLYTWAQHGGPDGAANLAWGILLFTLLIQILLMVALSDGFMKENPDTVKGIVKDKSMVPSAMVPILFDTPDFLLFGVAAWYGAGGLSLIVLVVLVTGVSVRKWREERCAELYGDCATVEEAHK